MSSLIGRKLGQYEIIQLVGTGGMATVYKAYQPSLDRHVAIKVLPPHPGMDAAFIERFRLEARSIGNLQNPNILPLYDYGNEDDILYLVMAYVEGGTLQDYLDEGAGFDLKQIEKWVRGIASGLDYAHRRGIVHRDIKPANILIDSDKHPLLADFGVVKLVSSGTNLTGTSIVGTPAYMSPEQGQGLEVDGRSDIYSLAVMVYEMLTGARPYDANTPMQIILKHINAPVPNILEAKPSLPKGLAEVMSKALAKEPTERYSSAVAFAEAFTEALHGNTASLIESREAVPLKQKVQPTTILFNKVASPTHEGVSETRFLPLVILGAIAILVGLFLLFGRDSQDATPTSTPALILAVASPDTTNRTATPRSVANNAPPSFGQVRFTTGTTLGDTVVMTVNNVRPPASGTQYLAWLKNTTTQETLKLGRLDLFALGDGSLTFRSNGVSLPFFYNAVIITSETRDAETPSENIAYSGAIPPEVIAALYEILIASPDGISDTSLFASARTEARFARDHSGLAARATTLGGLRTHAEHTINILQGTNEDYTGSGSGVNPGRGFGVFVFLDKMDERLAEAVNTPQASLELQTSAEFIRVCTQNVREWATEMIELEKILIAAEDIADISEQATQSTALAQYILEGVDANENGAIEPFEGECGLAQIEQFGVQVVTMSIVEGATDALR